MHPFNSFCLGICVGILIEFWKVVHDVNKERKKK